MQGVPAPLVTTILSPTALLAVVPASLLTQAAILGIVVENPSPGGASAPSPVSVGNIPTIFGVFSAASYASATISPGELVTMFGSNIGPAIPATMVVAGGYASNNLGGVTVTIGGLSAPILYVSLNQVTVQVPYEVGARRGPTGGSRLWRERTRQYDRDHRGYRAWNLQRGWFGFGRSRGHQHRCYLRASDAE